TPSRSPPTSRARDRRSLPPPRRASAPARREALVRPLFRGSGGARFLRMKTTPRKLLTRSELGILLSPDIASPPSRCRCVPEDVGGSMRYVCDASEGKTWFRIESEAEAVAESETMRHAVEKYFRKEQDKATQSFRPV